MTFKLLNVIRIGRNLTLTWSWIISDLISHEVTEYIPYEPVTPIDGRTSIVSIDGTPVTYIREVLKNEMTIGGPPTPEEEEEWRDICPFNYRIDCYRQFDIDSYYQELIVKLFVWYAPFEYARAAIESDYSEHDRMRKAIVNYEEARLMYKQALESGTLTKAIKP